jgi:transposase
MLDTATSEPGGADIEESDLSGASSGRVRQRRAWSIEEKRAMVELAMEPEASVPEIAGTFGVAPASLYSWRKQMIDGGLDETDSSPVFARVVVDEAEVPPAPDPVAAPGRITIAFPSGAHMRIEGAVDSAALAVVLAELGR